MEIEQDLLMFSSVGAHGIPKGLYLDEENKPLGASQRFLSRYNKQELANYMIERWTEFKEAI